MLVHFQMLCCQLRCLCLYAGAFSDVELPVTMFMRACSEEPVTYEEWGCHNVAQYNDEIREELGEESQDTIGQLQGSLCNCITDYCNSSPVDQIRPAIAATWRIQHNLTLVALLPLYVILSAQ